MRGKGGLAGGRTVEHGITPAYAGKRVRCSQQALPRTDHPRMCGEKPLGLAPAGWPSGSPPRMRGKGEGQGNSHQERRITPAYAGKSSHSMLAFCIRWDHPRVCGEKNAYYELGQQKPGSPPRMRGKVTYDDDHVPGMRITPAYAGKRLKRSRSTVPPVAIVPLFPSVCNKPVVSDGSPAGRDAPLFLPAENAVPASPACNLRSL